MLHPSYKDSYFKDAGWPSHWIKNARDMLEEEFQRAYKKHEPDELPADSEPADGQRKSKKREDRGKEAHEVSHPLWQHERSLPMSTTYHFSPCSCPLQGHNVFDHIPTPSSKHARPGKDEIARYFATVTEETSNPLRWWLERRALFPCLSRMAIDYLSIPGECPVRLYPIRGPQEIAFLFQVPL